MASWSFSLAEFEPLRWIDVGGGFSGARVWRGDDAAGTPRFALKQWPASMNAARLAEIHGWMEQAGELSFVPRVIGLVVDAGRVWDLTTWMPGEAGSVSDGFEAEKIVAHATGSLAALHRVWRPASLQLQPMPAILRRLAILDSWKGQPESVARFIEPAKRELRAGLKPVPVQPCLCDVHRDHILFTGDTVTGIIDYGAMKLDHVAVDLARYLGDVCGEDDAAFERGFAAYCDAGGILALPSNFVRLLDRTGIVCARIGWTERPQTSRAAIERVERLDRRLAAFPGI